MANNLSETFISACKTESDSSKSANNEKKNLSNTFLLTILCQLNSNLLRTSVLFLLGSSLCLVLNILQMEYKSNLFPSEILLFLKTLWWVLPLGGLAAGNLAVFKNNVWHKFKFNLGYWSKILTQYFWF